jgi:hypothetical protein
MNPADKSTIETAKSVASYLTHLVQSYAAKTSGTGGIAKGSVAAAIQSAVDKGTKLGK